MDNCVDFLPDWVSPPGATVKDFLLERGLMDLDFAKEMNMTLSEARGLLNGSSAITMEIAVHLSRILGLPIKFWLTRESHFRDGLIRLSQNEEWLKQFPVGEMTRLKWIAPANSTREKIGARLGVFRLWQQ